MSHHRKCRIHFRLTVHAQEMMAECQIARIWIERVLNHPDKVEIDRENPGLRHALGRIPENGDGVLRVIYNDATQPWSVVTAFFDRRAGRVL